MDFTFFNPRSQKESDFLLNFVARTTTLSFFLQQLRLTAPNQAARHLLVVAPRGYGKTSLLRRISIAVRTESEFNTQFIALTFREEQHNVISLDVFWRNCLIALLEAREDEGADPAEIASLEALCKQHAVRHLLKRDEQDGDPAWQAFHAHCQQLGRRPVLLIDNLDSLLAGLTDQHQWGLRRVLQREDGPWLMAAASRYPESTHDTNAAFFDFFRIQTLDRLSDSEVILCLRTLASHRGEGGKKVIDLINTDPGRISALNTLSGGNPRTLAVLYSVLEAHMSEDILSQLNSMLDTFTGWYQARTDELPMQTRAVFDALALNWDPMTAAALGAATGLDTPTVSSHLARMEKLGFAESVSLSSQRKGRNGYQVSERFFNIWYLMRHGPRSTQRAVKFLTAFLQSCFNTNELREMAKKALNGENSQPAYALALAMSLRPSRVRDQMLDMLQTTTSKDSDALESAEIAKQLGLTSLIKKHDAKVKKLTSRREYLQLMISGYDLMIAEKFQEAEASFRQAIALSPKDGGAHLALGKLMQRHLGRFTEAETHFRKAVELNTKDAEASLALGKLLHRELPRLADAEAAYRNAIKIEPNNAVAQLYLGTLLYEELGRFEEAEEALRASIALDPHDEWSHMKLGSLLLEKLGRFTEAELAYKQALKINPKNAFALIYLGIIYCGQNRLEDAEASYRKAIASDPKQVWSYRDLADLLLNDLGQAGEAMVVLSDALKVHPSDALLHRKYAFSLALHGSNPETAQAHASQVQGLSKAGQLLISALPFAHEPIEAQCQRIWIQIDQALASDDKTIWTNHLDDLQRLLWYVIVQGQGDVFHKRMEDADYELRLAPLFHAFSAALDGPDHLLVINPETRRPAQQIYAGLAQKLRLYPNAPTGQMQGKPMLGKP